MWSENLTISVNLVILVHLNCLLSEPGFSGFQDFQNKRFVCQCSFSKGNTTALQRNIYSLTPNPGNLGSDNILVVGRFARFRPTGLYVSMRARRPRPYGM